MSSPPREAYSAPTDLRQFASPGGDCPACTAGSRPDVIRIFVGEPVYPDPARPDEYWTPTRVFVESDCHEGAPFGLGPDPARSPSQAGIPADRGGPGSSDGPSDRSPAPPDSPLESRGTSPWTPERSRNLLAFRRSAAGFGPDSRPDPDRWVPGVRAAMGRSFLRRIVARPRG